MNLKFTLTTYLIILLTSYSLSAQKNIGISMGINNSTMQWVNFEESGWDYNQSWFIGVNSLLVSKGKWEITNEIQFSNKGWRVVTNDFQTFKYIDVLSIIKFKPLPIVNIYGGLNIGFLLNDADVTADRFIDPGYLFGASIQINKLSIFGHYNRAILNNELDTPIIQELNIKAINSSFQFGVNYTIAKRENSKNNTFFDSSFELGLSTRNLDDFRILYKQKISNNNYARFSAFRNKIRIADLKENTQFAMNFGVNIGIEQRMQFDRISINRGILTQINFSMDNNNSQVKFQPGIGYLFGAQYDFNSNVSIGFEISPMLTIELDDNRNKEMQINLDLDIDDIPSIYFIYHIER